MTWGWVNYKDILIWKWTNPLIFMQKPWYTTIQMSFIIKIILNINIFKYKAVILNSKIISQYYLFCCILDQINAGLVDRRVKNLTVQKLLTNSVDSNCNNVSQYYYFYCMFHRIHFLEKKKIILAIVWYKLGIENYKFRTVKCIIRIMRQ